MALILSEDDRKEMLEYLREEFPTAEERQAAMEEFLIKITQMKSPDGKFIAIPYLTEMTEIYQEAENKLYELFQAYCKLYLENYVSDSDADVLRTAVIELLVYKELPMSDEDVEIEIERLRQET